MVDAIAALAQLRSEIDAIDEELAGLLALRFAKTDAVGRYKALLQEAPLDEQRQLQRGCLLQDMAKRFGLPMDLVNALFLQIQQEVLCRHRAAGCTDATVRAHSTLPPNRVPRGSTRSPE